MDTYHDTNAITDEPTLTDGGSTDTEQLARIGAFYLKRDRNKAGADGKPTISIYTAAPRTSKRGKTSNQSVRVAPTHTSDPLVAEIALKRFVLTDAEAKQKERERQETGKEPSKAIDRRILEVMNDYFLGHVEAKGGGVARAVKSTMANVAAAWPDNPYCSTLTRDKQKQYPRYMRSQGYSDHTTASQLSYVWSAMHWCDAEGTLGKFPARIAQTEWEANLSSNKLPAYELEELAALFVEAHKTPAHWRYMVCATATGARPMALIELRRVQLLERRCGDQMMRLCQLNPEGRRQTKKRRATVPMCPTFYAEAKAWPRTVEIDGVETDVPANAIAWKRAEPTEPGRWVYKDHELSAIRERDSSLLVIADRLVGLDTQSFYVGLSERTGIPGSPMRIRKTVRTWLAQCGVPDPMADIFVGHAEEGSATGRRWYKHLKPDYLRECTVAIEKLFQEIESRTGIPFAGSRVLTLPNQPEPSDAFAVFLARHVTATWQITGRQTLLTPPVLLPVQSLPAHA